MYGYYLALALLGSSAALADPADCIRTVNDLDRLACYDKEHGRTPTATIKAALSSKWVVQTEKSKLTDKTEVFLSVESDDTFRCRWRESERATLFVRCADDTTALIVHTGCHMTSSEYNSYGDVTYRLDDTPARTIGMFESTNNESLGLWRGGQSIPVIKSMLGKKTMLLQMTPFGENPITMTFTIAGLDDVIAPLREACKW